MTIRIEPAPESTPRRLAATAASGPTTSFAWSAGCIIEEVIVLTPRLRIGLWLVLFIVVVINTALLAGMALLYHFTNTRGSPLWAFCIYFLGYQDATFLKTGASVFATGYVCLATLFTLYVLQLVYVSVKRRGLHFGAKTTTSVATSRVYSNHFKSFTATISTSCGARIYQRIRAVRYLISVHGPFFDFRLLADELINLLSQTGAAYGSSRQMSNAPLNLCYGVVICLTGLCPSIVERIYRKSLVKQRMACLVVDLVLDFVWGTLLPLWATASLAQVFLDIDPAANPDNSISTARQIEYVAILSWESYALSVIPFIATLLNLVEIQSMLREVHDDTPKTAGSPLPPSTVVLKLRYTVDRRRHGLLSWMAHKVMPLYGILALIVTLVANRSFFSSLEPTVSCIYRVYPWFMTDEACVGRRINCSALGISGMATEIEHALDQFTTRMLTDVLFTYCPALSVPRYLTTRKGLETITIRQSHIVQWNDDAAVNSANFPKLRGVQLVSVTFQDLPAGLIAQPLAHSADRVHLNSISNATELLEAVGTNWERVQFFDCVACKLVSFPSAVKAMTRLSMLQMTFDSITHIPDDWNVDPDNVRLAALWLDVNTKMPTLPDSLWRQAATTEIFSLESSGLREVPDWLVDIADDGLFVFAANTPLCADPTATPSRARPIILCETVYG
jgi:hypothetical protein